MKLKWNSSETQKKSGVQCRNITVSKCPGVDLRSINVDLLGAWGRFTEPKCRFTERECGFTGHRCGFTGPRWRFTSFLVLIYGKLWEDLRRSKCRLTKV